MFPRGLIKLVVPPQSSPFRDFSGAFEQVLHDFSSNMKSCDLTWPALENSQVWFPASCFHLFTERVIPQKVRQQDGPENLPREKKKRKGRGRKQEQSWFRGSHRSELIIDPAEEGKHPLIDQTAGTGSDCGDGAFSCRFESCQQQIVNLSWGMDCMYKLLQSLEVWSQISEL